MGSMPEVQRAPKIDLAGLVPALVTPLNLDGSVDYAAIQRLGSWLGSIPGVKGLVVLGHAGEGTFLTEEEQVDVIKAFVKSQRRVVPSQAIVVQRRTNILMGYLCGPALILCSALERTGRTCRLLVGGYWHCTNPAEAH